MGFNKTQIYIDIVDQLAAVYNVPDDVINSLKSYRMEIFRSEEESKYSSPMLWIGMYIALASLICILAMVGDLLHGLRTRRLWFPCKYFTVDAASLTLIAIAMKLPVDLTTSMPGNVDQVAKLGSMAFMCSMMANLLPSFELMDRKELFTNIVALVLQVTTLVVNICIQIATGVVKGFVLNDEKARIYEIIKPDLDPKSFRISKYLYSITATIYVTLLLMLLIIHICSYLAIPDSEEIIESNYARDLKGHPPGRSTVESLTEHVMKYWIIWAGSPQFITVCSATISASGAICVLSTILYVVTVLSTKPELTSEYCESDYKWSMSVILVTQFIGVVVGTIAPLTRCFTGHLMFTMSWNDINVFKTESYWVQKLSDWKHSRIPIPFRSRKCWVVIENLKLLILSFLIRVQKAVVVTCKMISLILFFFIVCVLYCVYWLKPRKVVCRASGDDGLGKNTHQLENYNDFLESVSQLCDGKKLHKRTVKSLLKYVNRLILKGEKQRPSNLMKLLEESSGFEGVEKFDNDRVLEEYPDCWSLTVVTLTAIVVSLPNIEMYRTDYFWRSVSEALRYVTLVEESLNATGDYINIQKAAKMLWQEVENYHKWLGHKPKDSVSQLSIGHILQWFSDTAKDIVTEEGSRESRGQNIDSIRRSICANSMYRITETIKRSYQGNFDQVSEEELFTQLSSMISGIVAACLTNLPEVIALKCHSKVNVHAAPQLLSETREIIYLLQERELPSLQNPEDFHFIHKWRAHLRHP